MLISYKMNTNIFVRRTIDEINSDYYPKVIYKGSSHTNSVTLETSYHNCNLFWEKYKDRLTGICKLDDERTFYEVFTLLDSISFEEPGSQDNDLLTFDHFYKFAKDWIINVVNPHP